MRSLSLSLFLGANFVCRLLSLLPAICTWSLHPSSMHRYFYDLILIFYNRRVRKRSSTEPGCYKQQPVVLNFFLVCRCHQPICRIYSDSPILKCNFYMHHAHPQTNNMKVCPFYFLLSLNNSTHSILWKCLLSSFKVFFPLILFLRA